MKKWQHICVHNSRIPRRILISFAYLETGMNTLCTNRGRLNFGDFGGHQSITNFTSAPLAIYCARDGCKQASLRLTVYSVDDKYERI